MGRHIIARNKYIPMGIRVDGSEVRRRRQALPGAPSLRSIARAARLSPGSLSRIENGTQGAGAPVAERLAKALRCAPKRLLATFKDPPPDRERIAALERRLAALEAIVSRGQA